MRTFTRYYTALSLLACVAGTLAVNEADNLGLSAELTALFDNWMTQFGKAYHTVEERVQRAQVWLANHERIVAHNSKTPLATYTLGHNEYSDLTQDEFHRHFHLGAYAATPIPTIMDNNGNDHVSTTQRRLQQFHELAPLELPDFVNWIQIGAVTEVKNQGACGACWAFSTTGALEGAKFIKTGELVSLSEQNLLDCDHTDLGCSGGLMDNAFKFDEKSGGLCAEADYPYQAIQNSYCNTNCTDVPGTIVQTFIDVPPGDEKALLAAVAMQPISVAIEASQFVFQFYHGGVITDDSCGSRAAVDHGVLAVGYGTDLDTNAPYFLVKNSWGETWGDNGYVKLGRGSKNEFGMCAILKMASFPVVKE